MSDLRHSMHQLLSPYALLCIQEQCAGVIMDADQGVDVRVEAQILLDDVNLELSIRGRCTCCGMQHHVTECHRIHNHNLENES